MSSVANKIPVTVLTGFLGSGKTTLLNRILSDNHGKRIAVIENEFGEVGVDNELVIGAGGGNLRNEQRVHMLHRPRRLDSHLGELDETPRSIRPHYDRDHRVGGSRAGGADVFHG